MRNTTIYRGITRSRAAAIVAEAYSRGYHGKFSFTSHFIVLTRGTYGMDTIYISIV